MDRLRRLYPHLFDEDGNFIYNKNIPDWMKFGPKGAKYGPTGIIDGSDDELSSLQSDEEYYYDEDGKKRKRKIGEGSDLDD
jgi:hypothetical protein